MSEGARRPGARWILCLLLFAAQCARVSGQAGYIYTKPDAAATGGIEGTAPAALSHAMAIDHTRTDVFLADLSADGKSFKFEHLPIGKYDLVLVTNGRAVMEGLALGPPPAGLPAGSLENLEKRIDMADSFFNRRVTHRVGIDGEKALVFVERIRDGKTLKQSGEALQANLRRLEVIELARAGDDWQMVTTRHLYREGEAIEENPPFFREFYAPELGNIRVISDVKQLGAIPAPAGF